MGDYFLMSCRTMEASGGGDGDFMTAFSDF
jgi:hypothetical protein